MTTTIANLHNFFDALPAAVQADFDAVSRFRTLEEGTVILRAGDPCRVLHQLCEGRVKYTACDYQGRETVAAHMEHGDWIGLSEMFTELPALSDVVALSPVRLRTIRRHDFEALMDRHPVIARHLLRLFSLRFSVLYHRGLDRIALTLKERLLKTVHALALDHGKGAGPGEPVTIRMSQDELAKLLGASRQKLNRALKELEREGLVTLGYGTFSLPDRDAIATRYGYLLNGGARGI